MLREVQEESGTPASDGQSSKAFKKMQSIPRWRHVESQLLESADGNESSWVASDRVTCSRVELGAAEREEAEGKWERADWSGYTLYAPLCLSLM